MGFLLLIFSGLPSRSRNLQCQRIFQVSAPVNCVCLHPNQSEQVVGYKSGVIHLWDLKTDHNEQLVENVVFYFGTAQVGTVTRLLAGWLSLYVSFPEDRCGPISAN
jgi:WD40 repeat protein